MSSTGSACDPLPLPGSLLLRLQASSAIRTDAEAGLGRPADRRFDVVARQPPVVCAGSRHATGEVLTNAVQGYG